MKATAKKQPGDRLLTFGEVAERLSTSERTAIRYVRDGKIASVKLGTSRKSPRRVRESDLLKFIGDLNGDGHTKSI